MDDRQVQRLGRRLQNIHRFFPGLPRPAHRRLPTSLEELEAEIAWSRAALEPFLKRDRERVPAGAPEEHAGPVTLRLIAGRASRRASSSTGSGALLKAASLRRIAGEIALLKAEKGYSQRDRDDDRLLRVDEVLKRVGVKSRVTLWRWVREGATHSITNNLIELATKVGRLGNSIDEVGTAALRRMKDLTDTIDNGAKALNKTSPRGGRVKGWVVVVAAARKAVIISEPVENLSASRTALGRRLGRWLSNPGVGKHDRRFDSESSSAFAQRYGAEQVIREPGRRNAIAVFRAPAHSRWAPEPMGRVDEQAAHGR